MDTPDLRVPVERLLRAVVSLSGARAAALRMLEPEDGTLHLIAAVGVPAGLQLQNHMRGGDDCRVCQDVLTHDTARSAPSACACARDLHHAAEERIFVLPLHHGDIPCGVLNLFFDHDGVVPEALSLLLPALGDMMGLAIDNAILSEKVLHHSLTRERQMLAGEVHDGLAQSLTWLRMRTRMLRGALNKQDTRQTERYIDDIDSSLAEAHTRVRELITDFRTSMDPRGLDVALRQVIEELDELSDLKLHLDNQSPHLRLHPEQERQVFHIVREALSNIVKHAQARSGWITITEEPEGVCCIHVEDDGVGLPADKAASVSYGMHLMLERAHHIGAKLEMGRRVQTGGGTWLRLLIPANAHRLALVDHTS
ncbi:sensor histidine kinase [Leptothrix ochracea]|uniref:sensor histidine kinase n=1 Tax=Leptothrix ochracea TaxID=735331 RepID=UPI0034E1F35D